MIEIGTWQTQGGAHAREGGSSQDAVLVAKLPWGAAVIVSDGCSSGKAAETGAWILARSAMMEIQFMDPTQWNKTDFLQCTLERAERSAQTLGLSMTDALATLSIGWVVEETARLRWAVWGDGYAGLMNLAGDRDVRVWTLSSAQNMPFYPGYFLRTELLDMWEAQENQFFSGFLGQETSPSKAEIRAGIEGGSSWKKGDLFVLSSDGAGSLPQTSALDSFEVLKELKGLEGNFLARRMGRALKIWGAQGNTPQDDFSMGGILQPDHDPKEL